jgi:signal transduction histidine kinase
MVKQIIKILYLEDDSTVARLVRSVLAEEKDILFKTEHFVRLEPALKRLKKGGFDVVLTDLQMSDSQGLDTFLRIQRYAPTVPIVIMSATYEEKELAIEALGKGAQDYLMKDEESLRLLSRTLSYAIERNRLMQLKEKFVSIVAHELRTPITIIKTANGLLLDMLAKKLDKEQKNIFDMIEFNVNRLTKIINDLLDLAKYKSGKTEIKKTPVDIVDLIKNVVISFQPMMIGKTIEIKTNFPERPINIEIDRDKITQVFTNLFSNAVKFTFPPQKEKEKEQKAVVEIFLKEKSNEIECSVKNTGIGISKEDIPSLFSVFRQFGHVGTGSEKGTGLGLSIVKEIIELHDGKVWAESEFGKWAKFTFTLPK